MNETILTALSALGFTIHPVDKQAYTFDYEGMHYVYRVRDDGDGEGFLQMFVLTNIDYTDCGPYNLYRLMDKTNDAVRYVKCCMLDDSVCLYYESPLFGYEDYERLLRNMVFALEASFCYVNSALKDFQIADDEFEEFTDSDDDSHEL